MYIATLDYLNHLAKSRLNLAWLSLTASIYLPESKVFLADIRRHHALLELLS